MDSRVFSKCENTLTSYLGPQFEKAQSRVFFLFNMISVSTLASLASILGVTQATYGYETNPVAACAALASSLQIPNVTVNFATFVPAKTNLTLSQGILSL